MKPRIGAGLADLYHYLSWHEDISRPDRDRMIAALKEELRQAEITAENFVKEDF